MWWPWIINFIFSYEKKPNNYCWAGIIFKFEQNEWFAWIKQNDPKNMSSNYQSRLVCILCNIIDSKTNSADSLQIPIWQFSKMCVLTSKVLVVIIVGSLAINYMGKPFSILYCFLVQSTLKNHTKICAKIWREMKKPTMVTYVGLPM